MPEQGETLQRVLYTTGRYMLNISTVSSLFEEMNNLKPRDNNTSKDAADVLPTANIS